MLSYIDDSIICENQGYHVDMKNEDCLVWVLLILKYKTPVWNLILQMAATAIMISRLESLRSRRRTFSLWTIKIWRITQSLRSKDGYRLFF